MSSHSFVLPKFSGLKADFPVFKEKVLDCAAMASSLDPQGLTGFFLSVPAFTALFGGPFVPLQHPGQEPAPGQARAWKAWAYALQRFELQQSQLQGFTHAFVESLDVHARLLMEQPGFGIRGRTARWMFNELIRVYGTITPADLLANTASLELAYVPAALIRDYTAAHARAHMVAATNGQPLSEAQKVRYLVAGLAPSGVFRQCVDYWHMQYATLAAQTFELLRAAVHSFADNMGPSATSQSLGYASANAAADRLPLCAADLTALIQQCLAAQATASSTSKQPATQRDQAKHYCWSHGPCGHSSQQCEHRRDGHIESATLKNQQGGATKRHRFSARA